METKEYRSVDRSKWPSGEWDAEPDKMQWPDPATGLPCLAVRQPRSGHWCGYVGVTEEHPAFGKDYDGIGMDIDVHGGLTFASFCADHSHEAWETHRERALERRATATVEAAKYPHGDSAHWPADKIAQAGVDDYDAFVALSQSRYICHIPGPGEPDRVWWFGFDCAHSGDYSPSDAARWPEGYPWTRDHDDRYRTLAYVRNQCASLARQLAP